MDPEVVPLDHPRFRHAWASVFTSRLVADCMTHACKYQPHPEAAVADAIPQGGAPRSAAEVIDKPDACCQYGCDVDLLEQAAILARADDIRPLLRAEVQHAPWFDDEVEEDPDYPSGKVVRTALHGDGCLFLAHDRRGCAIHRAALERGWDFRGVKPAICRLFPLSYEEDTIVIADEYPEYSCAHTGGPTLYRLTRDTLGDVFGRELVAAMDAAEARVLAAAPRRLPVL